MQMKLTIVVFVAWIWVRLAFATTYYVATNGSDVTGDGSAANPFLTISNGIAYALTAGDVVMVSPGKYVLTAALSISRGITLRAASTNPLDTVVDGNYPNVTNRCLYLNHSAALVCGFTFSNGCVTSGGSSVGAGVYVGAGVISNCWIVANATTVSGGNGAGLLCIGGNSKAWNCVIRNNYTATGTGAGATLRDGAGLYNSTVANNLADGGNACGGLYAYGSPPCVISNCLIYDNRAPNTSSLGRGGGVFITNAYLVDCEIYNNYSSGQGGGVYLQYGGLVERCRVISNTASTAGGGVYMTGGGQLRNCLVASNALTAGTSYGGGLCALAIGNNGGFIESCTIVTNRAMNGGGLSLGNSSTGTSNVFVTNCIVWLNFHPSTGAANNLYNPASASNLIAYCCLPDELSPPNNNNITNAPVFVAASAGNYRLTAGSPGINAGINQSWMADALDLDGYGRLDRFNQRVDMGAYEYLFRGLLYQVR